MNESKKKLLLNYMNSNVCPILVENVSSDYFKNCVILASSCDVSLLNGRYEETEFVAPSWYNDLIDISKKGKAVLVIDKINDVDLDEQTKFIEILKYRKISTFDLPKDCVVVLTCNNLKEKPINEEVYSLVAHIEG